MKYLLILMLSGTAFAQTKPATGQAITQFEDWAVFTTITPKGKICYAASQPKTRLPKELKRDPAFINISTRPAEKIVNEVAIHNGFANKADVDAVLTIGTMTFPFFTKLEGAWVKLPADEIRIITAFKTAKNFTLKSTSLRGNALTDTYSLAGFVQALEKVSQECK